MMASALDCREIRQLPWELAATFKQRNIQGEGYPWWTQGDTNAFFALFFDNCATQLALAGLAIDVIGMPAEFVWGKFFGGVGLSIFVGNLYYTLQASKVALRSGRVNTCAQPYGINTPGAIAKTFGVLGPVFWATGDAQKAWETACIANFLGGIFEALGAFVMPMVVGNVPEPALLVPMGGIGLTWLGINPLVTILSSHFAQQPMVGLVPLVIIWTAAFGSQKASLFGKYVPSGMVAAIAGMVLNLLAQTTDFERYRGLVVESVRFVKFSGFAFPGWGQVGVASEEYGSLILGLAFTNFVGTYACNISARRGGDAFPVMESMLVDGFGSMIGGLCGSPYGTTVYIGHVCYKKMGATRGYSLLNGVLWLVIGPLGLHGLLNAILPHEIICGILVVVGLSMASQVMECTPRRWYPAVLVGLGICFADFIVGGMQSPNKDIKLLQNGYVWISCLFTWFLMMLTDRWFLAAAGVFMLLCLSSLVGLIHAAKLSVRYDEHGTIIGSETMFEDTRGLPGYKLVLTYALCALLCVAFHLAQRAGYVQMPEQEASDDCGEEAAAPAKASGGDLLQAVGSERESKLSDKEGRVESCKASSSRTRQRPRWQRCWWFC